MLKQLGAAIQKQNLPCLVAGDWNMTPEELTRTGWCDQLKATIVHQPGVEVTSTAGTGNYLDYFVASWSLLAAIQPAGLIADTPWKHMRQ